MMEIGKILSMVDHTLLTQTATWDEIKEICDDGMLYQTASVCIPPSFVKKARQYAGDKLAICTVIGFPNGYSTTAVKVFETRDAIDNGADEIDMVINLGDLRSGDYTRILNEIVQIKRVCGRHVLKVIVETCLLNEEEKIKICEIVTKSGADFIKTSTGFSTGGAMFADVELFSSHIGPNVKIKAAGGISSLEDASRFIELGCSRLGTSRIVRIAKKSGYTG